MTNSWKEGVSIVVPTYKRPNGIKGALESLIGQSAAGRLVEIIVSDNDPQASAKNFVLNFAKTSSIEVIYKHVPEPGVSNARNGALSIARGRFIAFLDDDMKALPGWLDELVKASLKYKAGITFGPAIAIMPNREDPLNPYMEPFFSRIADAPEGYISKCLGTGGCLLDLSTDKGTKVAWAIKAESHEIVPTSRATPTYMWKRNFAFGQGPSQEEADKGLSGTIGILKWMIVGLFQFFAFAPACLVLKLLGQSSYIHFQNRTAQALGKIFWWSSFKQKLYGVNSTTGAA